MVIKIYTLYFYQSPISIGPPAGNRLMDYFNNFFTKYNILIENTSSQYFRQ